MNIQRFQELIWAYYREHGRRMPWRETTDPYAIVVSEIMLQQTQVSRVLTKYPEFLGRYPNFEALATAELAEVLSVWQGMGYNRRAMYLQRLAQAVAGTYGGQLPSDLKLLQSLPGIGPHTAGSIAAFAFNLPTTFIETNIRRTFIYHFFPDMDEVTDREIGPLVTAAVDQDNPREWYYALMDYGAALSKSVPNPNRQSKHYTIQSSFEGSQRQLRGQILRVLLGRELGFSALLEATTADPDRLRRVVGVLEQEGFVVCRDGKYYIK